MALNFMIRLVAIAEQIIAQMSPSQGKGVKPILISTCPDLFCCSVCCLLRFCSYSFFLSQINCRRNESSNRSMGDSNPTPRISVHQALGGGPGLLSFYTSIYIRTIFIHIPISLFISFPDRSVSLSLMLPRSFL